LSPRQPVVVDVVVRDAALRKVVERQQHLVAHLACVSTFATHAAEGYQAPAMSAVHSDGRVEVVVHLKGLIDEGKERARLQREIEKAEKERAGLKGRLDNADFVARAPADVVEKGRADLRALDEKVAGLQNALGRLSA
jgi:valyl-tRNA synthetase